MFGELAFWQKLLKEGIHGKILNVIKNMYAEIKSCVLLNGVKSEYFNCEKGVRQGENLSPLLFSLYLNDLENFLESKHGRAIEIAINNENAELYIKLFLILYADDTNER